MWAELNRFKSPLLADDGLGIMASISALELGGMDHPIWSSSSFMSKSEIAA